MSKSSVRQVGFDGADSQDFPGESPITEYFVHSRTVDEVYIRPRDEYPYPEQSILEGTFKYEDESFLGIASASVAFQLRRGSRVLFVQKKSGSAKLRSIVSALDERLDHELGEDVTVHDQFHPSREGIWSFIHSAEWVSSLTLRIQSEDVSFTEYAESENISFEDIDGEYPIAFADLVFEAPWGDPVSVIYDHGHLEVATNSDELYEFILQRFETDVLAQ
ncbi:hypothetical protein [Halalkalicoccus subterraneus]|uniref:hypothetical protein n=1 Tax=Halalkalicoccus subterraneus TaxID=2675002 RepID=UPI0013CEC82A|nr:hypothetical protein [Halalkalicoccus subterraneus]